MIFSRRNLVHVTYFRFQPTVLEIANFELFSSGPQNIKISGSERYPSNEWVDLGDFVIENNREIQRFPIAARSYVKFFRVNFFTKSLYSLILKCDPKTGAGLHSCYTVFCFIPKIWDLVIF